MHQLEAWLEKQNVNRDVMMKTVCGLRGDGSIHPPRMANSRRRSKVPSFDLLQLLQFIILYIVQLRLGFITADKISIKMEQNKQNEMISKNEKQLE